MPVSENAPPALMIAGLQTCRELARDHVDGNVSYAQPPPVGGKHSRIGQNCGWYDASARNENAVHSLEHGAAWITYSPTRSSGDKAAHKTELANCPYVVASPYTGPSSPAVASARGAQVEPTGLSTRGWSRLSSVMRTPRLHWWHRHAFKPTCLRRVWHDELDDRPLCAGSDAQVCVNETRAFPHAANPQ